MEGKGAEPAHSQRIGVILPLPNVNTACFWTLIRQKVKFTLEQATKAQMGSRGIVLLFL